jgi:alpha-tubulin suppressor-like RCC1 family protein
VWAWGSNGYGQLGDGTKTNANKPVQVWDLAGVKAIASSYHGLAALDDGTVWAWGFNDYGQLGDATTNWSTVRRKVVDLTGVKAVAAGFKHSLALLEDGTVWAWGLNDAGQLGDGSTEPSSTRHKVLDWKGVKAVAAGSRFNLALLEDGAVYSWGQGNWHQLGQVTDKGIDDVANKSTPAQVVNLTGVTAIAAGLGHGLALLEDGTVCAWGSNEWGQGGHGKAGGYSSTPLKVRDVKNPDTTELTGVKAIAAGSYHSLALLEDGTVCAWGWNEQGQLGDGSTTLKRLTPVKVKSPTDPNKDLTGVKAIAAGFRHSLACCDQPVA